MYRIVTFMTMVCLFSSAAAEVTGISVNERADVLDGRAFGDAGAYEKLSGVIHFAWDPADPENAKIVDLDLAPKDEDGRVEAVANFMVLQPKDPARRSGIGLLEVSNRGGKAALAYFDRTGTSRNPTTEADFGDGFLLEQGLTIIWVGWQWDVPPYPDQLRIEAPIAEENGETIYSHTRADWVPSSPTKTLPLADRGHVPYTVARPGDEGNVLTVRQGRDDPRTVIPRTDWSFAEVKNGNVVPSPDTIYYEAGFEPGKIYELVYHTKNPRVVGIGLAAVRDTIAYAKHDEDCPFPVDKGIAFGVSQTGRFLRHFLYQGFNTDEHDRIAFDGMLIHAAGAGRGSFNHRFAQPSRDAHRFSAFFYPTDLFPFTSRDETDPLTGETDGLLSHTKPEHRPKIFYTNTGYEYWGRGASLVHTSPDGTKDVEPLENERIYHLASGQHFVAPRLPSGRPIITNGMAWIGNPLDFMLTERALLQRLIEWTMDGTLPPESKYPRIDKGTLVPVEDVVAPKIFGVTWPDRAHVAYRVDYGPRWREGIIDNEPPKVGEAFPVLVPQVDEYGNELGGVATVELLAPMATYTGWARRYPLPNPEELLDFVGMFCPAPRIAAHEDRRDSRPPVEVMYSSKEEYLSKARESAESLVGEGFLLERDVEPAVKRAEETWDWVMDR